MRKVNVCLVWTLIFKLQFIEIHSDFFEEQLADDEYYDFEEYDNNVYNNVHENRIKNIERTFENIYQPSQYPIDLTSQYDYTSQNHAVIKINKSSIPQLHEDSFSVKPTHNVLVTTLEITFSRMTKIDLEAFVDFPNLLKLKLDYNHLTEIQQIFYIQTELQELSLSHNNISWIDLDAFKPHKNTLKFLDLSFNSLDSTSILSNLDNLNGTKSLFGFSEYLENLDLSNNQLEVLDRGSFSNNSNLLYLNLSRNSLTEVKFRVFDKLSELIYLNLSRNFISKLDLGFSIGLNSLKTLDLSFNRLSVLDLNVFHNTPVLENLQLHNNFLKNISIIDLSHFTTLESISIHDNNMDCSLLLKTLKVLKWMHVNVDKGSATETYSFHGISCNISSTTEKSLETTSNFQNSNRKTSPRSEDLENFEEVFLNSKFYGMFSEFVKNQKEKLDILPKSVEIERNQNLLMERLKEITLNVKSENETVILELIRDLSVSISENLQKYSKRNQEHLDINTKPNNIFYTFIIILLIIMTLLLLLTLYVLYKFLIRQKALKDWKEMQPIIY